MRTVILMLIVVLLTGCAITRTNPQRMSILDPSQDTSFQPQTFAVPIFSFFPASFTLEDTRKWLEKRLPGAKAPR